MRNVNLKFSDQRAREIEYFLRNKFNAKPTTSIEALIDLTVAVVVSEQAAAEAEQARRHLSVAEIHDELREIAS